VGNLRSVQKAFAAGGHHADITCDPDAIRRADKVVLPGVGAFGAAVDTLRASGLEPVALDAARSGRPFLGICVGMQLLFDESEEMGRHRGLGLLPGRVLRFDERNLGPPARGVKVPQIGWNALHFGDDSARAPLFAGLPDGSDVYFVHSYFCRPDDESAVAAAPTLSPRTARRSPRTLSLACSSTRKRAARSACVSWTTLPDCSSFHHATGNHSRH
jgi:glutamine amidotransferase